MKNLIIITAISFMVIACSDHENHTKHAVTNVVLNDGFKWEANEDTTIGIKNMKAIVDNYLNTNNNSHEHLKQQLQEEFAMIFKKCTMKGEAHNQLHNFLLPLKNQIGNINSTTTHQKLETMAKYLSEYDKYFK